MKIYTRTGDKGYTTLIGGKRVPKNHGRIEAYGTVDELIAHIGLLHAATGQKEIQDKLIRIEDRLMACAAILASDQELPDQSLPEVYEDDLTWLENAIDKMQDKLPALDGFVLPGGDALSSQCHIARTVCRRAERKVIDLMQENHVPELLVRYINRLSDFLFVMARKVLYDEKKEDIRWDPDRKH
jgi:cob(I)alamin adenosyltransferase